VISINGKAEAMSIDHKPDDEKELARIKKAGGEVFEGRVNGNLNLSRAIGDL
jgi:serine/threonine protein phosphatase PrpC